MRRKLRYNASYVLNTLKQNEIDWLCWHHQQPSDCNCYGSAVNPNNGGGYSENYFYNARLSSVAAAAAAAANYTLGGVTKTV